MKSITPERCQQELQEVGGTDFGFAFGEMARFRVAIFKQRGNVGLVLRRIPNEFLTFEQLGLPAVIEQLIQRPRGLILVTGPTGSGKTTSLASMVNYINATMDRHIITIEDPIEYFHKHNKCIINQREIGVDVPDFPEAIRRALRMDPDIILVGEMRDLATISAAITAAETGHIVFATLHTNSAEGTVNRVIDVFPKDQQDQIRTQLSVAIIGILAQALLPRKPKGLVAAYEMLVVTPAICQPDPRKQDVPDRFVDPDRAQARHDPARRQPVQPVEAGVGRGKRGHVQVAQARRPERANRKRQEGHL